MRHLFSILLLGSSSLMAQVTLTGNIKITPGNGSNPGISITNGAVCAIASTSLPSGLVGIAYGPSGTGVQLTSTNCSAPVVWSLVLGSGTLPAGLTLTSGGLISGTPSAAGNSSVVVTLLDNTGHRPVFPVGLSITAVNSTSPALPDSSLLSGCTTITCTPSPNTVITVGDGITGLCVPSGCNYTTAQLNTAASAVGCGQILQLQNTVYSLVTALNFNKICDPGNWITIERDVSDATFPLEGTRVTPCYSGIPSSAMTGMPAYTCASPARHMPFIQKTATGVAINIFGSYYRFVGIEWGRNNSYDLDFGIISMSNNPTDAQGNHLAPCVAPDLTCMNAQATNIVFDRNIIHGDAQRQTSHAIGLGGARWVSVLDSYIYDIGLTVAGNGGDAQPFAWGNGKELTNTGWMKFINNFESASTMGNLFCGSFSEPLSPATGFDGIPHDFWFNQDWFYKNELWDTQRFQAQAATGTVEGVDYPPAGNQEYILYPATMQLQVGQTITLQSLTANDSWSGINRSPAGVNTLACPTVTASGGVCGTITTTFIDVGTGDYISRAQFNTVFKAPASVPPGVINITRAWNTSDGRLATIGKNLNLTSTAVFTIVSGTPTPQIVLTPKAGDVQIQPSYSDSFGNSRQFELLFNLVLNFTSSTMTWKVDAVTNGNSTVGQMCSTTSTTSCIAPASNDQTAIYWSGTATGNHTITVTSNTGVTDSSVINVSATAPIVGWDYRAFTSKNGFELKCGRKGLIENFLIENAWGSNGNGGGQGGQFMLIHPFNQNGCTGAGANCSTSILSGATPIGYGPFEIADLTIRNGKGIRFGAGFVIGSGSQTLGIHRVSVTNVLCVDCDYKHNSHGFANSYFAVNVGGVPSTVYAWESATNPMVSDLSYHHVTLVGGDWPQGGTTGGTFAVNADVAQPKGINYILQDSIFASTGSTNFVNPTGGNTNCNTAGGIGSNNTETKSLIPCFATYTFHHLALLDSTASPSVFVSSPIWQPASTDVGLFIDFNGGNYCVVPGGIYDAGGIRQASDGLALGANICGIGGINSVETAVRAGVRTP